MPPAPPDVRPDAIRIDRAVFEYRTSRTLRRIDGHTEMALLCNVGDCQHLETAKNAVSDACWDAALKLLSAQGLWSTRPLLDDAAREQSVRDTDFPMTVRIETRIAGQRRDLVFRQGPFDTPMPADALSETLEALFDSDPRCAAPRSRAPLPPERPASSGELFSFERSI